MKISKFVTLIAVSAVASLGLGWWFNKEEKLKHTAAAPDDDQLLNEFYYNDGWASWIEGNSDDWARLSMYSKMVESGALPDPLLLSDKARHIQTSKMIHDHLAERNRGRRWEN